MRYEASEMPLPANCELRTGFESYASDSQLTMHLKLYPLSPNDASFKRTADGGISELKCATQRVMHPLSEERICHGQVENSTSHPRFYEDASETSFLFRRFLRLLARLRRHVLGRCLRRHRPRMHLSSTECTENAW